MPTPIATEVWALLAQWIVYGASVAGAITAIAKFASWCRSKTRVAQLEEIVKKHEEWLTNDHKKLAKLDEAHQEMRTDMDDMHELMRLNLKSSQALLKSALDGNNKENMEQVNNEIQDYLNSKI